jgi:hypothetical protein
MNLSGNWLLQNLYKDFFMNCSPSNFSKMCWNVLNTLNGFDDIWQEVKDILNPNSPPKNIKRLQGKLRNTVILDLLEKNKKIIFNELFKEIYVSNGTYN